MKLTNVAVAAGIAGAMLFAFTSTSRAQGTVRVGGTSLRANGELAKGMEYSGACPVSLKFGWGLLATAPAKVSYSFARSDGAHAKPSSVDIPEANQVASVSMDWHLGANNAKFENYSGWVELKVDSPNAVAQKIPFTIHCSAQASAAKAEKATGGANTGAGISLQSDTTVEIKSKDRAIALKPEEKVAFVFVRSISTLQGGCAFRLKRYCSMAELVAGPRLPNGNVLSRLKYDPAKDNNYKYTLTVASDSKWQARAEPQRKGLAGFYVDGGRMGDKNYYSASGAASATSTQLDEYSINGELFTAP